MDFRYFLRKEAYLEASFRFFDFKEAFAFMTEIAEISEKLNHHPDWENSYNLVKIRLSTHDAGHQITEKDIELAFAIEETANRYLK